MIEVYKTIGGGARVGVELTQIEKQVTVNTSPVSILKADPDRIAVLFSKRGSVNVAVSLSLPATVDNGIFINPAAGPTIINDWNMPGLAARAWYAIADTDGAILEVLSVKFT